MRVFVQYLHNGDFPIGGQIAVFNLLNCCTIDATLGEKLVDEYAARISEEEYLYWDDSPSYSPLSGYSMAVTLCILNFLLKVPTYRMIAPDADIENVDGLRVSGFSPTSTMLELRTMFRKPDFRGMLIRKFTGE